MGYVAQGFDTLMALSSGQSYYVSTTGSDNNNGSQATPFLTIQKAFNFLANSIINSNITINVSTGTYTEQVTVPPLLYGGDYRVTLQGATTRTDSGTCSANSTQHSQSGNNVVHAKLTDSSKSWTVNAYQKKFLHITGGKGYNATDDDLNWYMIISNTSTTISIAEDWNSTTWTTSALNNTTTYEVITPTSTINGNSVSTSNITFRGNRVTVKNIIGSNSVGFAMANMDGRENLLVACSVSSATGASCNVGIVQGGFRTLACYLDANTVSITKNICFFESFSIGDYAENFITSNSFPESKTGIKGCWLDGGTTSSILISGGHTRLTGNYFTNIGTYAIDIGRCGNTSIYGNDISGGTIRAIDQSYIKVHSGNKFATLILNDSTVFKQNGGPTSGTWFTSIVGTINADNRSSITPSTSAGFNATTENNNTDTCIIYGNATQSIANSGSVTVVLDTVRYDPSAMRSGNTVVIQKNGMGDLSYNYSWGAEATPGTKRTVRLKVNSTIVAIAQVVPLVNLQTAGVISRKYPVVVGDVISVTVSQDVVAGNTNLETNANWSNELSVCVM